MSTLRSLTIGMTLVCASAAISGCYTGIHSQQLTGETDDVKGLRYYLPAPLLVVDEIAPGKYDARVEFSIDRSKVFSVQPTQYMATSSATIEFNDDGTVKSFQLDQDSSDIPAAFVEGLRDLELKKLELEKAALDEAKKNAESGKPKSAARAAAAAAGGREVCVYRIDGPNPVTEMTTPCRKVIAGKDPNNTGAGEPGAAGATIDLSADEQQVVVSRSEGPLGSADWNKLTLLKTDRKPVADADKQAVRAAAQIVEGQIRLPVQTLRERGVATVSFENEEFSVPTS